MKKTILMILMLLFSIVSVNATDILLEPYSESFNVLNEYGVSQNTIRTNLNIHPCTVQSNWESKECQYLHFCYAILPSTSNSIFDALQKECVDVTTSNRNLEINQFVPPKGVLYYVTIFFTIVNAEYNDATEKWYYEAEIPTQYVKANDIRSVCPQGQMLDFDPAAGEYKCYFAERACLDTQLTGLCTNAYTLYVLDKNEDGQLTDSELIDGSNYCADRPLPNHPQGDGICDITQDLECVDVCKQFNSQGQCIVSGANGLCDEWDLAVLYGCWDDELSANSKICDTIDIEGCLSQYNPVCVGGIGGTTYPNECFAKGQGYNQCPDSNPSADCYNTGACEPPITQCYVTEDCPVPNVCVGGSTSGITAMCLGNMCSYTGVCGNLGCVTNADCESMTMPCVGVTPQCSAGVCTIAGSCLTPPTGKDTYSLWQLIANIWNAIWNFIRSLFG